MKGSNHQTQRTIAITLVTMLVLSPLVSSQTKITPHKNKYSVEDDVRLGRQAAAEVERKTRIVRDEEIESYIQEVGNKLVNAIPQEFQQPAFQYTFRVVLARDINAFALPGGPMYVHTGMILAAKREGEMAGVMAHEISHVALRHATAQATRAAPYQTLGTLGAIGGAILGGGLGTIIGQGAQMGAGVLVLKYSREFETEADVLGAQIMARAGYNPRDLSQMFRTIESTGGGSGPQWLSSHPNPGNRYQRIEQEASQLRITGRPPDEREFARIKARLGGGNIPTGPGEPERGYPRDRDRERPGNIGNAEPPSPRYRSYSDNNSFRVEIPENWRDFPGQNSVWFSPEGGYSQMNGQDVHTHGVLIGVVQNQGQDLRQSIQQLVRGFQQSNPELRQTGDYQRATLANRDAGYVPLSNVSRATGEPESVEVIATRLRNGSLLYVIAVAPQRDLQTYKPSFQRFARTLQVKD